MRQSLFIIGLLLIAIGIFEFHPAVEYWRIVVPEEVYVGKDCECDCIMGSRPWYSTFNYWFWLWVIATPVIVFSVKPSAPGWQRAVRTLICIGVGYGLTLLSLDLSGDIRNGPFWVVDSYPWQKSWDNPGVNCVSSQMGARVFTVLFGWIYALIYTGWWEMIWYQYHKRKTQLINKEFKRDWISRITVWVSKYLTLFVCLILILMPFAIGGAYVLEAFSLSEWYKSFFF